METIDKEVLGILLKDRTTNGNIIWMTDSYAKHGDGYSASRPMTVGCIWHKGVIRPRTSKSESECVFRTRSKGEVFTPAWICNLQCNVIDADWFGREGVFNSTSEDDRHWKPNPDKIVFPKGRGWQDYVLSDRLEITCGEAPYIASRYDMITGDPIPVSDRIGFLDRKLRIVGENCNSSSEWLEWAEKAVQSVYGYEWQGDNLLLARSNVLLDILEHYEDRFGKKLVDSKVIRRFAEIVSWNLWQMDGLKFVIPMSCHENRIIRRNLFGTAEHMEKCPGCSGKDPFSHNGIYCMIMNWKSGKPERFADSLKMGEML